VNRSEVEDAVSEVFIVTWRKIDKIPVEAEVLPWLYGIARNVVRNVNRSSNRRLNLHSKIRSLGRPDVASADVQVIRNETDSELLRAVARLSSLERELLRLRTWEELPISDIALVVGKSTRSVESKLGRTRRKLADMLGVPSSISHEVSPRYAEEGGGQ
jgi:RNA polymerase sigma-70 factor (ECF subfamily)